MSMKTFVLMPMSMCNTTRHRAIAILPAVVDEMAVKLGPWNQCVLLMWTAPVTALIS